MAEHTKQISPEEQSEEQSAEGLLPASGIVTGGVVPTRTGVPGGLTRTLFVALAFDFGFVNFDIFLIRSNRFSCQWHSIQSVALLT